MIISLYHSTNWLLDLAMLVSPYILAGPTVSAFIDGVHYASYTTLSGIVYLVLTSILL